jgi:DNA-binding transcriptional LysR family regulator
VHHLRSFVAVAEELHFGNAGLRLGLSQPQVSRHVAALEQELGVALFVRTPRRTTLTDAGAELLSDAREALDAVHRLQRRARIVASGGLGSVSVGFIWSKLGGYLAPLVAAAAERHPQIELSVRQLRFRDLAPAMRRGDVDLLISRSLAQRTELVEFTLNHERSLVAIPERHPLARRRKIALRQLHGEPLVTLSREVISDAFDASVASLRREGVVPSAHRTASAPMEALALVAAGVGIYYRMPASALIPQPGVAYCELDGVPMCTLLIRRPEPPSPAVAAIAALIEELFSDASGASHNGA